MGVAPGHLNWLTVASVDVRFAIQNMETHAMQYHFQGPLLQWVAAEKVILDQDLGKYCMETPRQHFC